MTLQNGKMAIKLFLSVCFWE